MSTNLIADGDKGVQQGLAVDASDKDSFFKLGAKLPWNPPLRHSLRR
jgi:hypothetical protein